MTKERDQINEKLEYILRRIDDQVFRYIYSLRTIKI